MKTAIALTGGLAGSLILTAIHQLVKKADAYHAPRMDLLGMESLQKIGASLNLPMPSDENLYKITMAADVMSNTVYYSAAGLGNNNHVIKGALLGLAAGVGAVYLPKPLGLNEKQSNRTPQTQALSVLYYLAGGLVAGTVVKLLAKEEA